MDRRPENTFCALDDIVVEPAPSMRDAAWARQAADSQDLLELSRVLADAPQRALQRLVELAMQATAAGSAGLSLEEHDETGAYLRWVATAGLFSRYVNGTMPRDHSPCGTAMDRAQPLVMRDPVRYYTYVSQLDVPLRSVLLVPFARGGKPLGTVWAVSHDSAKNFDVDDVRAVQDLAGFASEVLDAFGDLPAASP